MGSNPIILQTGLHFFADRLQTGLHFLQTACRPVAACDCIACAAAAAGAAASPSPAEAGGPSRAMSGRRAGPAFCRPEKYRRIG